MICNNSWVSTVLDNKTILVVDDDAFHRLIITAKLHRLGLRDVWQAASSAEALAITKAQSPDIIFCDIRMEGQDGMDLLAEVEQARPATPVVIVSGLPRDMLNTISKLMVSRGVRLVDTLKKPLTPQALRAAIDKAEGSGPRPAAGTRARPLSAEQIRGLLDKNAFEPFFEPKIDARTGAVKGFELLARVRDGERIIPPALFIDTAEKCNLIPEMTLALLDQAFQNFPEWLAYQPKLCLSFNASVYSLADGTLIPAIVQKANDANIPVGNLMCEVTESQPLGLETNAWESLIRFRMANGKVSIDDFGTGHSSMQNLSKRIFDELKIDRQFSESLATDPDNQSIVASSVQIARKFSLSVCVEGVASPEIFRTAHALGADAFQGWLFDLAMPADRVPACMEKYADGQIVADLLASTGTAVGPA